MVKRKASESIDAWLQEGESASATIQQASETAPEAKPILPPPTVKDNLAQVTEESAAVAPADVEVTDDEAANWFWGLLEQAGFELW